MQTGAGMFKITLEGRGPELILPEQHVWAILERDGMREGALNHGFIGMGVFLGEAEPGAPKNMKFVERFHRKHVLPERPKTVPVDLDFFKAAKT